VKSHSSLALLGFGNVGRAFAKLLLNKNEEILKEYGLALRVVGIATAHHGLAIHPDGIDLHRAIELTEHDEGLTPLSNQTPPKDTMAFIEACGADALIETLPVNYTSGQPALDYLRAALRFGMHAITANKGPVVFGHEELTELARFHGKHFYFESTVMDGAPVFSLWREALPAAKLLSFRGILNSTTNLILTRMEEGISLEEALTQAQSMGIAETDPSGDLEGWDSAIKVAALCTVLMGAAVKPEEVEREGIRKLTREDVLHAQQAGQRWKLICEAKLQGVGVGATVHLARIDPHDPLYHVMGTSSAVTFESDVLGALTLMERNPGPSTTAYGLLADLLNALRHPPASPRSRVR
jgi:homoserine dehydrogenase